MKSILIAGAGPVGLTLAAELARHGVRSRIIDKAVAQSTYCRALGVTARTLEIWDDMGIAETAIGAGMWTKERIIDIPGQPLKHIQTDYAGLNYGSFILPQYETERILTEHLNHFGIQIERGISLTGIQNSPDNANVTLTDSSGNITTEVFDYVIGCDGAHSNVRRLSNIGFEGEMIPYEFMLADVQIEWGVPRGTVYNAIHPATDRAPDFFLAIPLPDANRYRISTLLNEPSPPAETGTDHGIQSERPAPGLDAFQEIANRLISKPAKLSDIRWSSIFRISMRLATKYRVGNTFVAGDAAHIHPPTGGQGMNTGIQDAYNLAWKLALVCKEEAKAGILDSYEAERQEEGLNVINRTMAATMSFGKGGLKPDPLADAQMLVSYRNSPLVKNDPDVDGTNPLLAGDRAPDCYGLQRYGLSFPMRLFELLRGTDHVLLVDARSQIPETLDGLNQLLKKINPKSGNSKNPVFRIIVIAQDPETVTPFGGIQYMYDPRKLFAAAYHSADGASFIIRPDGYIGWRGNSWKSSGMEEYLNGIYG